MEFVRIGLIDFFGIFAPGVLLLLALLSVVGLIHGTAEGGAGRLLDYVDLAGNATGFVVFFFVSYLLGSLMRLGAVQAANCAGFWWLRRLRGVGRWLSRRALFRGIALLQECAKETYMDSDSFPHPYVLDRLENHGDEQLFRRLQRRYADLRSVTGTTRFNIFKLVVAAKSDKLFLECKRAESMIRFYAGTFLAMLIASIVFLADSSVAIWFWAKGYSGWGPWAGSFLLAFVIAASAVGAILSYFPRQRIRETHIVYTCMALILNDDGAMAGPPSNPSQDSSDEGEPGQAGQV